MTCFLDAHLCVCHWDQRVEVMSLAGGGQVVHKICVNETMKESMLVGAKTILML